MLFKGCDRGSADPSVDMEIYPSSPRKYPPIEGEPSSGGMLHIPPLAPDGTARVCVITSVVVDTPSVVVCSVDVEPCSVLSQSIVHATVQEVLEPPLPPLEAPSIQKDSDVMDRICHDLDYLLGGLPHELKPDLSRLEENVSDCVTESVHQTML